MLQEKDHTINPAIEDPNFKTAFKGYVIIPLAPASSIREEKISSLKALDVLDFSIPEDLQAKDIPYHAHLDKKRLEFLKAALYHPSDKVINWVIRGGYGSARLLDELNKLSPPKTEKIMIGYSDITALNLFLSQKWHWKPIHGAGLTEFLNDCKDPENLTRISDIIAKRVKHLSMGPLEPLNTAANSAANLSGTLTGGNLTVVQTSIGTPWQIETADKILFFEDTGEKGYRIDRALTQLKQAGLFKDVVAIVFGHFIPGDEHIDFALQRFAMETKIPVFKTDKFGHGYHNYPLIYNAKARIVQEKSSSPDLAGDKPFSLIMNID